MIHLPDDTPATLLHPDGHWTGTLKELREELGPTTNQVLSTSDAARIWPAYSESWWRRQAGDGAIPGAWKDNEAGPWRLPYASCKSFVLDLQRRALRSGERGPKGPWSSGEAA